MDLVAIDDSAQKRPTRDGVGPLVAVGGVHVPGGSVRDLEHDLHQLCRTVGFPDGEEFKWSPDRNAWMRQGLVGAARKSFYLRTLAMAQEAGAIAIVAVEDTSKKKAQASSASHEDDVTMMFLERAHNVVSPGEHALVVFDRPGGKGKDDFEFLSSCMERLREGTEYAKLDRLALALSTDSKLSRLIQLADVVTACTTALVGGESTFAPPIFERGVRPLLRESGGCVGGRGLKIHPDFRYGNLYHWLGADEYFLRGQQIWTLPSKRFTSYHESGEVA